MNHRSVRLKPIVASVLFGLAMQACAPLGPSPSPGASYFNTANTAAHRLPLGGVKETLFVGERAASPAIGRIQIFDAPFTQAPREIITSVPNDFALAPNGTLITAGRAGLVTAYAPPYDHATHRFTEPYRSGLLRFDPHGRLFDVVGNTLFIFDPPYDRQPSKRNMGVYNPSDMAVDVRDNIYLATSGDQIAFCGANDYSRCRFIVPSSSMSVALDPHGDLFTGIGGYLHNVLAEYRLPYKKPSARNALDFSLGAIDATPSGTLIVAGLDARAHMHVGTLSSMSATIVEVPTLGLYEPRGAFAMGSKGTLFVAYGTFHRPCVSLYRAPFRRQLLCVPTQQPAMEIRAL